MEKPKKEEIQKGPQYGLKSIQVNRYNYSLPKIKITQTEKIAFDYNITPVVKYNLKENLILIFIQVNIFIKETSEKLVEGEIAFIYSVKELNALVEYHEKETVWKFKNEKHEGLIVTLVSISLSTLRGILFEKNRGSIIESAPLPIMDPTQFIKKEG